MSARPSARRVDVRVLAATNRDLEQEVAAQRFREDLYYRLRVIDLHVPPLRERPEDLRRLADALLAQTVARQRRPVVAYAPAALERILHYAWPGNIRELAHAIERACAVATGPWIEVDDLPSDVGYAPLPSDRAPDAGRCGTANANTSWRCWRGITAIGAARRRSCGSRCPR